MKKAVVIGAGNIGRGLNAFVLHKNNFSITFLDTNTKLINLINSTKEYNVIYLGEEQHINKINNFDGFDLTSNQEMSINSIVEADVIFISIGFSNLKKLSPFLSRSLMERQSKTNNYLNIVAIENGVNASEHLKKYVEEDFAKNNINLSDNVSFSNCLVDRIVPKQDDKNLDVFVEPFYELVIDQETWIGNKIKYVDYSTDIKKFIMRKLFMLNGTHTFVAWSCIVRGYKFVNEFLKDSKLKMEVKDLLNEYGDIIIAKYDFTKKEIERYKENIFERISNSNINDSVLRVGRSVITKISSNNRLSMPIVLAIDNNLKFDTILKAISLPFSNLNFPDEELKILKNEITKLGKKETIKKYTNLPLKICDLIYKRSINQ